MTDDSVTLEWADGTRAFWVLDAEALDDIAEYIERKFHRADSIKC